MKKQLIILALLLVCSSATFAQSTFNNQSFETMMSRYVKDPMQYLNSEAAPDLVMVGANGLITDINGIQGLVILKRKRIAKLSLFFNFDTWKYI